MNGVDVLAVPSDGTALPLSYIAKPHCHAELRRLGTDGRSRTFDNAGLESAALAAELRP